MSAIIRYIVCLAGLAIILGVGGIVGHYHSAHRSDGIVSLAAAHEPSEMSTSAASTAALQDKAADKPACLDCHGPFDKLASAEPSFAFSPDMKINPHRYAPHNSKEVPDCAGCHEVHPVLPTEPVKKPTSVAWCYVCHHLQDFTDCKQCH
jgi:hypothetical protein